MKRVLETTVKKLKSHGSYGLIVYYSIFLSDADKCKGK
jgi:hypothetical protein